MALPRRSRVVFTVPRTTWALPFQSELPRRASRYLAFYFPRLRQGWALMPDPGSTRGWPAILPFGYDFRFMQLKPGRRYTVLVATDRSTTVRMPFPMDIVKVRHAPFPANASSTPVSLLGPASGAALGSMPDRLGRKPLVSTAVAIDWTSSPSELDATTADACPSASKNGGVSCGSDNNLSYVGTTYESGGPSGPRQVVAGEGFDHPVPADYVAGYAANAPVPFDAVTLLAFAMRPLGPSNT